MTKKEHMSMIEITKKPCFKEAYYADMHCGEYTLSWTNKEIKEDVYHELKERGLLIK